MSKTAPSFEAKKPLPLPKFPSSTWRWEPGAVPFLPLRTIPGSADHLPWPWEQTNPWLGKLPQLIFHWAIPQNSFEYSMGSKCVDVSVPVRQSEQQGVTETKHKTFLSLLSVPQVLPRASMPERDYSEQPLMAHKILQDDFSSKLWALPDIPQGKLTS